MCLLLFKSLGVPFQTELYQAPVNPIRTGEGGGGFLPITLEVIKVGSRNLVTFPKI